jgi:hypothetical protein
MNERSDKFGNRILMGSSQLSIRFIGYLQNREPTHFSLFYNINK